MFIWIIVGFILLYIVVVVVENISAKYNYENRNSEPRKKKLAKEKNK